MTLKNDFFQTLDHLGTTVPIGKMWSDPKSPFCGLRHDVDYDLDVALEMAHAEYQSGCQATYFLLPNTVYWDDPALPEKCLQLADYGHEVGLHVNLMADFVAARTDNIGIQLERQLDHLRKSGLPISGIAAHGDKLCYKHNVSNYWCFSQLRTADPMQTENGRTAEGPFESDGRMRLRYPPSHKIVRQDKAELELWSLDFKNYGIEYHAWHTPHDRYFSDSGGAWSRTSNPLSHTRGQERWQVLIHPIHWLGKPKVYFFLSTARSGSKYLAGLLNAATPIKVRHEHILNEEYATGQSRHKPTSAFRELQCDQHAIDRSLLTAWKEFDDSKTDVGEVNVYLSSLTKQLRQVFTRAEFVHLVRDPSEVVRSMKMRDWYATPEDHAHAALETEDAYTLDQFERIATHVGETNELLMELTDSALTLEAISSDVGEAVTAFANVGIVLHRRLADPLIAKPIDRSKASDGIEFSAWSTDRKRMLIDKSNKTIQRFYSKRYAVFSNSKKVSDVSRKRPRHTYVRNQIFMSSNRISAAHGTLAFHGDNIVLTPDGSEFHARFILGGSRWSQTTRTDQKLSGWPIVDTVFIEGDITAIFVDDDIVSLFYLCYDANGQLLYNKRVCTLDKQRPSAKFSAAPYPGTERFDFAFYIPKNSKRGKIEIQNIQLDNVMKMLS